jgi:hypothetical protein
MSFFSRMFIGTDREFGGIEMDAILVEQYAMSSTTTDHPVDKQADMTDHIIRLPKGYLIQGIVTDTPMGLLAALEQLGNTASAAINYLRSIVDDTPSVAPVSRSNAAFQALTALWEDGIVFDVQTGMGLYPNMAIVDIQVTVDQEKAGHLNFTARLKFMNRVTLLTAGGPEAPQNLEAGDMQEGAEPVKKEGLKQKITNVVTSVQNSVRNFFE